MDCLEENWLELDWSPWVPFNAPREFWYIQKAPGVYRIRPDNKDLLMYIGETGQSLHKKLAGLRQTLRRGDLMPWSDPYAEAPALWSWWVEWIADRDAGTPKLPAPGNTASHSQSSSDNEEEADDPEPVMLEVSSAPLDASVSGRKGMERFLLYNYRQEKGESPLCNFGRIHPRYRKSTTRAEGHRGGKLANDQQDNPAGFPSITPLEPVGKPGDCDWMGLEWTEQKSLIPEHAGKVSEGAGLYLLADAGTQDILYIGQSADIAKRLPGLCGKDWQGHEVQFSYQIVGQNVLPHNLKELEADLLGNYYENFRKMPVFQFQKSR
ncbi:hypothetical protein [Methanoregula sp.]|uniref:hypothetical protein n=1 Tax=Methanoregula sp. TaxID=2052170 RepID=UPI000CBFD9DA|nr:hypothetical protein [Methanoregula sp.]PKG32308.1 MAG: hypothetical protein CW742_08860 [Methanoregula sp.]